ncbi:hypothetical protein GNI_120030 [Gregarina niphandrodes]|uniref:Uncharacterized protein n=1 Tax=Gregarina niphandrodes TaxID=110365 RepID=A0A023B319_GRENI|nr:hypothetical protein GNI_120030 [Gregarina niphandrodes]EZG54775.1 hypothetical protein GNI_120030 [Gregarina niphandrodes]|eukprot:XP_011131829.1 hypothetical protein GNI_120030 [Gregarina niphandrodes]
MHEEEYNDLYKIAVLGTVPDSRSWSQKVSQKVLEYAAVATVVAVLQYGLCSQGFCKSIPGYCSNIQSYLTGNGSTTGDSTAVAPMAHGLYQAQTTEAPGLMQGLVDTLTTAAGGRTGNVAPVSELKETVHLADADIRAAIEADYFPKVIDGVVVKFPRHFGNVATLTEARNDLTTAVENLVMTGKPMETSNLAAAGNFTEADRLAAMVLYQQLLSDNLFKTYLEVTKQDVAAKFAEASIDIAQTAARDARGALMDAVKTVCEKWNMAATDLEAVARGVPTEPSTFVCHKLPTMSFAELNRPGLFVDPGTGWDLQRFRASFSRCVDMDFNPETTDIWLGALGSEWAPRNRTCGRAREGTLMCRGLGVSNPQCFDFEPQWETYPGGLGFLIDMIDRIFRPTGDENCVVRCGGSHALDTPTELWLKNAEERDAVRNAMSGRMDLGDACTRKQLEHFVQVVQKMYTRAITRKYAPEMLAYRAEELKHVWYRAPCGTGIWKPGEPLPTCACPKFSISCETDNHFKVSLTDTNHEEPERTPENVFAAIPPDFKIKRCAYQCLTKIFADANTAA